VASRKPFVHAVKRGLIIYELWFSSGKSGLKGMGVGAGVLLGSPKLWSLEAGKPVSARDTRRPNIVYIFTDQQSATMMSCAGNKWLKLGFPR